MRKGARMSDETLAGDIRRVAQETGRIPRQEDYEAHGLFALNTITRRRPWNAWLTEIFGQTNKGRAPKTQVLDFEIMEDIRRVGTIVGKSPTQREYGVHGSYPLTTLLRRKKWNEWLVSAVGTTNYDRSDKSGTKRIPDQDLADDVRRIAVGLGRVPTRTEYDAQGRYSSDTIVARKPWEQFAREACDEGMSAPTHMNHRRATEEELLAQIKEMGRKLGRIPQKDDFVGSEIFSYTTYARAFGTFGNALVKAGLIHPLNRYCVPRQELLDELRRVRVLLGHTPSEKEFLANSPIRSNSTIYSEFGSWTKAFVAAGIPVTKARNVTVDEIKIALREWHVAHNGDDSSLEYWKIRKARKNNEFPYSQTTIENKFPHLSWEEIMHECGFPNYITKDKYACGHKRGNHTGLDGNEYLSSLEKEIGDFLFELKKAGKVIDYEYEAKVCPNKTWTCDFKIALPDGRIVWLEADGLRKNRYNPYFSGGNKKINFYKTSGMDFAVVSYSASIRPAIIKILSL